MTPKLELKKFTELPAATIGERLSSIIGNRKNWQVLKTDFMNLRAYYGGRSRAIRSVRERQYQMRQDPRYVAMVVLADGEIIGVTSLIQTTVPFQLGSAGPNIALWLDPSRPAQLRHLGPEIMRLRLEYLLADLNFKGHVWSVIRPDNIPSLRIWAQSCDGIEFMRAGRACNYKQVDGVSTPRLLFTSVYTLEQLRQRR